MPTVAEVVRQYAPSYLERFGDAIPKPHKKVLRAIAACRTGALGAVAYACQSCGATHFVGRSCGDRHCPACQRQKAEQWLKVQTQRLLPCPYFLITFTLPAELREVARRHQSVVYAALFEASSTALRELASNQRFVGTDRLGFTGVLHTWGRTLEYHPHVHYIVPGGGLSADGDRWLPSRANFLVPMKALSRIFRAKLREILRRENLLGGVDGKVWRRDWVVHSQAAGDGRSSLQYLAPYVYRVAIGDRRIVSCDDGKVVFTYRKVGSTRPRRMTLDAHEFLRRFLQHVLPRGFQKVRHFGFLGPRSGVSLEEVRWLIAASREESFTLEGLVKEPPKERESPRCPECGGTLLRIGFVPAPTPWDTS